MTRFKNIACVGVGLIGRGWATQFAARGFDVTLYDADDAVLKQALPQVRSSLAFLEANAFLAPGEAETAFERIVTAGSLADAVRSADYVQESAFEDYAVKESLFSEMDAQAPERAILASSTSGLLMTRIQKAAAKPGRCVLVHPFLPVHLMPLVEVVGGQRTSPKVLTSTCELMRNIGKSPVMLKKEVPGFIVNRLQAALLREAIDLVAGGVASAAEVDEAFRLSVGLRGPFLGPLMRVHLAGDGIERFFENYTQSYRIRLDSMASWSSISKQAAEATIEGVRAMEMVRTMSPEELKRWRDEMIVKVLNIGC